MKFNVICLKYKIYKKKTEYQDIFEILFIHWNVLKLSMIQSFIEFHIILLNFMLFTKIQKEKKYRKIPCTNGNLLKETALWMEVHLWIILLDIEYFFNVKYKSKYFCHWKCSIAFKFHWVIKYAKQLKI